MGQWLKNINLALSGGGIKGIAYVGMHQVIERHRINICNIAGVSAGALAGSFIGAGYTSDQLKKIMNEFDFDKIEIENNHKRVPVVNRYLEYVNQARHSVKMDRYDRNYVKSFLNTQFGDLRDMYDKDPELNSNYRGNFFKNIILFSKEGCILDGDYLEEWVYKVMLARGIKTFGDLRGGLSDKMNPRGYRVRMTAVDANRARAIVLPDDIAFYGMDPDKLEVSKAVRMSTAVPFAFRPVVLKKNEKNQVKTYNIVDGGVLDNLPLWTIGNTPGVTTIAFRLKGKDKNKLFSLDTPLNILKALFFGVHDTGIPKNIPKNKYIIPIDTSKISFLDFGLGEHEKEYLFNSGKQSAALFFNKMYGRRGSNMALTDIIKRLFGGPPA